MKQAEKDSVGLMYLIVGYGSSGFGGIIKKSLIKILEKGVYKKLIRMFFLENIYHLFLYPKVL